MCSSARLMVYVGRLYAPVVRKGLIVLSQKQLFVHN